MSSFFDSIIEWFENHFGWLADFFKPMAAAIEQQGGKILVQAAQAAVAEVEADPTILTAGAKRDAAVARVLTSLQAAGIQAGISVVNTAIELAVQGLKAK